MQATRWRVDDSIGFIAGAVCGHAGSQVGNMVVSQSLNPSHLRSYWRESPRQSFSEIPENSTGVYFAARHQFAPFFEYQNAVKKHVSKTGSHLTPAVRFPRVRLPSF
ncbi:hypothetical protein LMH87_002834 [Akanthomyces muscarius]|uniref:Uncharacterized protein n=1 Tax=Akanthomyces muscarius TaxID=2231603 RepID=A0A9W8UJV0_AKAMU|nr:hypothetical protein LMH87_002834 [Akanthomyces muscarius]KAJ4148359.1 hypothetical protein LMH87_002834 [Akanthomyces muscarius]